MHTMVMVDACTKIVEHISCPTLLVIREIWGGGLGGEVSQESKKVWVAAKPRNVEMNKLS